MWWAPYNLTHWGHKTYFVDLEGSKLLELELRGLGSESVCFASNQSFLSWRWFLHVRNGCLGHWASEKPVLGLLSVRAWLCQAKQLLLFLKIFFSMYFFFFLKEQLCCFLFWDITLNNNSQYILSTYHVQGTVLSTLWINLFIFHSNPMSRYCYCSYSTEREIKSLSLNRAEIRVEPKQSEHLLCYSAPMSLVSSNF